jgi:hypothetical protein
VWQVKGASVASGVVTPRKRRSGSERGHRCDIEHHNAGLTVTPHREASGISQAGVAITFHRKALGDDQRAATATPSSQDYWITHVLDAKPGGHQPRAQTLLCAMLDAERRPACESLRNLPIGGNRRLAPWHGACLPQDWACLVTYHYLISKRSCHQHTSGMIESRGVAVRPCTTATQPVQALDSTIATSRKVLRVAVSSTVITLATCKSCQRPSYRSKHSSVVCSPRRTRFAYGNPLSLTRGGGVGAEDI